MTEQNNNPQFDNTEELLQGICNGNEAAYNRFWELHFNKLSAMAQKRLSGKIARLHDGEDIALSAINSFFHGLADEKFPQVAVSSEVWKILAVIAANKIAKKYRTLSTQKRGGGNVRGESIFQTADEINGIENVAGATATPDVEVEFIETCGQLFDALPDDSFKDIARLRMEGHTVEQIATQLGFVSRTVERKIKIIREIWTEQNKPK
jgi:DNA-directed RNA polymerase specialized sigma24 family protein